MLLFYPDATESFTEVIHFNTSNVTILQVHLHGRLPCPHISIHLMLLFYKSICGKWIPETAISIHLMLLFYKIRMLKKEKEKNFNTSNVTVLPGGSP